MIIIIHNFVTIAAYIIQLFNSDYWFNNIFFDTIHLSQFGLYIVYIKYRILVLF